MNNSAFGSKKLNILILLIFSDVAFRSSPLHEWFSLIHIDKKYSDKSNMKPFYGIYDI